MFSSSVKGREAVIEGGESKLSSDTASSCCCGASKKPVKKSYEDIESNYDNNDNKDHQITDTDPPSYQSERVPSVTTRSRQRAVSKAAISGTDSTLGPLGGHAGDVSGREDVDGYSDRLQTEHARGGFKEGDIASILGYEIVSEHRQTYTVSVTNLSVSQKV